jgi:hypothetical protein
VLEVIGGAGVFDAARIAELRYDKALGFDGPCNHAMHLFTEHQAIRTAAMNINFIFSGPDEKRTQWAYMYTYLFRPDCGNLLAIQAEKGFTRDDAGRLDAMLRERMP